MNAKVYPITTCDDPIQCPKPWTLVDSGYVMHEIGMGHNSRQPDNCRTQDPFRQMALPNRQIVIISREIEPLTPIHLAGEGGRGDENNLALLALSALRQLLTLAERDVGRQSRTSDLEYWFWDLSLREPSDPLGHKVGQKAKMRCFSREFCHWRPIA